ncbi:hypothetical protein HU200_048751 [Digitaria exilis]|uniref:EF-hand domain-containing protein n=1 Tax=Digitaria exilis TaxID=1010633 RepID=A0A835AZX7_9POAL|nr:hypothetical protein HU200_048751 [Digitaria exilis]
MFNMFIRSSCQSCNCQSCNHSPAKKVPLEPVLTDREVIKTRIKNQDVDMDLTHEDVNTMMTNIGLDFDQENSMVHKSIGYDSIARIFDDDEPSLQEVWQAFLMFDHNNDGYIDASDLQKMLQKLGLGGDAGMYECEQMIAKYDSNKDRKIDIAEFTKVLEAGIC